MTTVTIIGSEDVDLRRELLSRETARDALATYDLTKPFENSLSLETVSLGAAVTLLNDLNWYLVRFADESIIRHPAVDESEWLSRDLAMKIRNTTVDPAETGEYLRVYGIERESPAHPGTLVEPLYVRRGADGVPEYDLRDVDETLVVRVTRDEFSKSKRRG